MKLQNRSAGFQHGIDASSVLSAPGQRPALPRSAALWAAASADLSRRPRRLVRSPTGLACCGTSPTVL